MEDIFVKYPPFRNSPFFWKYPLFWNYPFLAQNIHFFIILREITLNTRWFSENIHFFQNIHIFTRKHAEYQVFSRKYPLFYEKTRWIPGVFPKTSTFFQNIHFLSKNIHFSRENTLNTRCFPENIHFFKNIHFSTKKHAKY